ncbi:hypothetical protein F5H01DRAFT_357228 [Linnemannia elongata]|nr:hypothetical protein F5H01DRAFT_357228 [Linnemannia elongata]
MRATETTATTTMETKIPATVVAIVVAVVVGFIAGMSAVPTTAATTEEGREEGERGVMRVEVMLVAVVGEAVVSPIGGSGHCRCPRCRLPAFLLC